MLFNSLEYLFFLPLVFIIYWSLKNNVKYQNIFLLFSSYFFYSLWDYRFLLLILISSITDFTLGKLIYLKKEKLLKKKFLFLSIFINIGILFLFKYYNFFIDSFVEIFNYLNININIHSLNLILPVGISFYTFQTLSYTLDIYNNKIKPSDSIINFFTFVAFFPQLVAGPIEKASRLLPQINQRRVFNYNQTVDGLRQILWGLFKKVVIADNCALFVNAIFDDPLSHNGLLLIVGVILFSFQIYGDFSGYSDIAIGTSKLFGITLMQNFANPYFSRNISEFWRRWHISLSSWFRDYLYIPLGGSRVLKIIQIRNILIIFTISGLWHGANWTFIFWGLLHATFYIHELIMNTNRKYLQPIIRNNLLIPSFFDLINILKTFIIISFAWLFFRSPSIDYSFKFIEHIIVYISYYFQYFFINNSHNDSLSFFTSLMSLQIDFAANSNALDNIVIIFKYILIMISVEWINNDKEYAFKKMPSNIILRYSLYIITSLLILEYFYGNISFIYFQF